MPITKNADHPPAKSHARAPGQTQITIALPESLKAQITVLAKGDNRTRSNWIVHELTKLVAAKKAETFGGPEPLPLAAEEPPAYGKKKRK